MRKGIFNLLFCTFVFLSLPVLAQQSTLLEKYRTMALDYNHDLKAAENRNFPVLPVFNTPEILWN